MQNVLLELSYDGTNYHGWQEQKKQKTVSGMIKKILQILISEEINIIGCSRTDAGVHAKNYVCNFITNSNIPSEKFSKILNRALPPDVVIKNSRNVPLNFSSRFDNDGKVYCYLFRYSHHKNPFLDRYTHRIWKELDIKTMNDAAKEIEGTKDYKSFMTSDTNEVNTIRTVQSCSVKYYDENIDFELLPFKTDENEKILCLQITATAYLRNMVRIIAGTLYWVGIGRIDCEAFVKIINAKDRTLAGETMPPNGLFLTKVYLPKFR